MSVKAIYNTIASQYANADCFGSITKSHSCATNQIKNSHIGEIPLAKILDLGVGDGSFLRKLMGLYPTAELTGIDVSGEMLKRASKSLNLKTIEASAADASRYLPRHSQDLVLAHFINAYVPINTLFKQAQILTRPNGYFSVVTSTYESFPITQQRLANFIARETFVSSIIGHYYKAAVKNTTVASCEEELLQTFHNHQFEIVAHERLHIPVSFNSIDELLLFGIEGTWFLNCVTFGILPRNFLINRIRKIANKVSDFPYHDTHVIDVILARK